MMGANELQINKDLLARLERLWAVYGKEGTFEDLINRRMQMPEEERIKELCAIENAKKGHLDVQDGYDCKKCLNRGEYRVPRFDGKHWYEWICKCDCWKARNSITRMESSGLKKALKKLSEFEATEPWQRDMLDRAKAFLAADHKEGTTMFIGGAVGCGKSHICAAVCRELLLAGHEVVYMQWEYDVKQLNRYVNDESFADRIEVYSHAEYLYIDDLFKPCGENGEATPADYKRAFEIINYRYVNKLPTIISTEKYITEILEVDSALASRIYERAKGFTTNIKRDTSRNYRMKGAEALV